MFEGEECGDDSGSGGDMEVVEAGWSVSWLMG